MTFQVLPDVSPALQAAFAASELLPAAGLSETLEPRLKLGRERVRNLDTLNFELLQIDATIVIDVDCVELVFVFILNFRWNIALVTPATLAVFVTC